ncbi:hypothetical protein HOA92_03725 [archaeon]|nr:hypothetical protein [archaeon]
MIEKDKVRLRNRVYMSFALLLGASSVWTRYDLEKLKQKQTKKLTTTTHYIKEPTSEAELVAKILNEYDPNFEIRLKEKDDDGLVYLVVSDISSSELGNYLESYDNQAELTNYLGEWLYNDRSEVLESMQFGDHLMDIDPSEQHMLEINLYSSDFQALLDYNGSFEADLTGPSVYLPHETSEFDYE